MYLFTHSRLRFQQRKEQKGKVGGYQQQPVGGKKEKCPRHQFSPTLDYVNGRERAKMGGREDKLVERRMVEIS